MSGQHSAMADLVDLVPPSINNTSELTMEQKIDKLLDFNLHITKAVKKIDNDMQDMRNSLSTKIDAVKEEVDAVKETAETNKNDISKMKSRLNELETYVKHAKIRDLNQAVHGRRYDLIAYRLADPNTWETAGKSIEIVRQFLHDLNNADPDENNTWDPNSVVIKEAHRLPQNPLQLVKNASGEEIERTWPRPMIFRLVSMLDKRIILSKCKNLKIINQGKNKNNHIYVDDHWPSEVAKQRKALRVQFNQLKTDGKKPKMRYNVATATTYIETKDDWWVLRLFLLYDFRFYEHCIIWKRIVKASN